MFGKVVYMDEAVDCVFCKCFHGGPCNTIENSALRNSKEGDNGEILVTLFLKMFLFERSAAYKEI